MGNAQLTSDSATHDKGIRQGCEVVLAQVTLQDVVWATEGGVLVDSLPAEIEMYDVFVGWLAG